LISCKVLGAYAVLGSLTPSEQASWYRRVATEWRLNIFEIPMLGGVPMAPELVETFADISASLVVTCVAQWAIKGQKSPAYGLSSPQEDCRQEAMLDVQSILQQSLSLSRAGIGIRNVVVHTGQRAGSTVAHAIALNRSLVGLVEATAHVLPNTELTIEMCDNLAPDHPIPFPAAKKQSLPPSDLLDTVVAVNAHGGQPVSVMLNWGRMLINGDNPLDVIGQVHRSAAPLAGVILSGAGATPDGFVDSHNSQLDPECGFTADDGRTCAAALQAASEASFLGMKCSTRKGQDKVSVKDVLTTEAELLNSV